MMQTRKEKISLALFGDAAVGKSELRKAISDPLADVFSESYKTTIGVDFCSTGLPGARLQIWDTSGQERFKCLLGNYSQAKIIFILFDMTDQASFDHLEFYVSLIRSTRGNDTMPIITLIATHLDVDTDTPRVITSDQAQDFAQHQGIEHYFEISLKTKENVSALYDHLTKTVDSLLPKATKEYGLNINRHLKAFKDLSSKVQEDASSAISGISTILNNGRLESNPREYFAKQENTLSNHLQTLRHTSASLCNSALNVIAMTFAYCSVVGILALWLTGHLAHNQNTKGSQHMFFAFGEKQKAEILIHEVKSASLAQ